MNHEGDCRTAPATPGLLKTLNAYPLCEKFPKYWKFDFTQGHVYGFSLIRGLVWWWRNNFCGNAFPHCSQLNWFWPNVKWHVFVNFHFGGIGISTHFVLNWISMPCMNNCAFKVGMFWHNSHWGHLPLSIQLNVCP